MKLENAGESWIPVSEAAARLDVDAAAIHRRHPHFLETRRLGDQVCVRASDVARWKKDGRLPYHDWEAIRSGLIVAVPEELAVVDHADGSHGPVTFLALRTLRLATRELQPGDLLAADEPLPNPHEVAGPRTPFAFAEVPISYGIVGYLRALQQKVARLEAELAEAKS